MPTPSDRFPLQRSALFLRVDHRFFRPRGIYSSPHTNSERVPLDKEKGFVKGEDILSGAEHRFACRHQRVWDRDSGISPLNHFSGGSLHRTIDTTENYYHDSSIRTSSRRVCAEVGNTGGVFQGACAVFCIDRSGCESTQSMFRARLRPGAPAGCSRYERSPDS